MSTNGNPDDPYDASGTYDHYSSHEQGDGGDTSGRFTDNYTDDDYTSQYDDGNGHQRYDDDATGYRDDDGEYDPYDPSKKTGDAMMDEDQDEDLDRDAEGDDQVYYDDEGRPLDPDAVPLEYYNDEYADDKYYYDEDDEDERRRRARRRRAWCCCLLLLCCLLILIILLIIFLLSLDRGEDEVPQTDPPTYAPFIDDTDDDFYFDDDIILSPGVVTTRMAPFLDDCDKDEGDAEGEGYRNVWDQCECEGEIHTVPEDVAEMRELIIDRMSDKFYDNFTMPLNSCEPANMALLWLASGDNRDAGEPRQRFALALTFFQLNGTVWDFKDEWLGEINECLWLGVQCNNRDSLNSLALDTNNIFGLVSAVSFRFCSAYGIR